MDLSIPSPTTNSPLTPVFGDNVQDLLGTGALHVNPSAIITVNSIDDAVNSSPGVTTLRDAINQANTDTGEDLIVFDRSLFSTAQTINLNLGELDITHSLDIIAPRDSLTGGDLVTVSGNKASRVFEIGTEATATLSGLIVTNASGMNPGSGGILNIGILTLDSSIVRNNSNGIFLDNGATLTVSNSTISGNGNRGIYNANGIVNVINSTLIDNGGGILNYRTVNVSNSTISGNTRSGIDNEGIKGMVEVSNSTISGNRADVGGGILNFGDTVNVSNSIISGNSSSEGGGIFNVSGTVIVSNSTLSDNSATNIFTGSGGGGIYNVGGILEVSNSTISGNRSQSGGGIFNQNGTTTISNSTLSDNSATLPDYGFGGGINNRGILNVSNSTISGNTAEGSGGGISNGGILNVSNSTFTGNSVAKNGGGINNNGTVALVFSTLTLNSAADGSGLFNGTSGSASVRNTIIAANLNSENGINPDVDGTFSSNGYNLIGDGTGSTGFDVTGDIVGTSDNPIDPRLAPLDFYGGSTQTIALLPDSPAIGAADPTVLDTDPTTDQRGLPRRASGVGSDIGAFEFSS